MANKLFALATQVLDSLFHTFHVVQVRNLLASERFSTVFTIWMIRRHLVDFTANINSPQVITPLRNLIFPVPANIQNTTFRPFNQCPQTP